MADHAVADDDWRHHDGHAGDKDRRRSDAMMKRTSERMTFLPILLLASS